MKTKLISLLAGGLLAASTLNANAGPIPYPNVGTPNAAVYTFTATNTGDLTAYFWGSTAGYTSTLSLLVNGVDTGVVGLNNHNSPYGLALDFGSVNAGDTLVFRLNVLNTGNQWYSDPTLNSDGVNHVYSTDFSGDGIIPAGTFVAFEDLPNGGDFNYNDEDSVFTNVSASVPEPASLMLVGTALLGATLLRRYNKV